MTTPYNSQSEWLEAMRDPRYNQSEDYRQEVAARLAADPLFTGKAQSTAPTETPEHLRHEAEGYDMSAYHIVPVNSQSDIVRLMQRPDPQNPSQRLYDNDPGYRLAVAASIAAMDGTGQGIGRSTTSFRDRTSEVGRIQLSAEDGAAAMETARQSRQAGGITPMTVHSNAIPTKG